LRSYGGALDSDGSSSKPIEAEFDADQVFAKSCIVDRTRVSRIERGVANQTVDVLERFARGLGVEVADLFAGRNLKRDGQNRSLEIVAAADEDVSDGFPGPTATLRWRTNCRRSEWSASNVDKSSDSRLKPR
jgi:transcriptional regulator with XRE-family HTH domain